MSDLTDSEIFHSFYSSVNDNIKHLLLKDGCRDLQSAIKIAADYDLCSLKKTEEINFIKETKKILCFNCNKSGHYSKDCFLKKKSNYKKIEGKKLGNVQCLKCKRYGHYANKCSKRIEQSKVCESDCSIQLLKIDGSVNGVGLKLTLDCGATTSIISKEFAITNKLKIESSDTLVKVANGDVINVVGRTTKCKVKVGEKISFIQFYVLANINNDCLLGLDWFKLNQAGISIEVDRAILNFPGESITLGTFNTDEEEICLAELHEEMDPHKDTCEWFEDEFSSNQEIKLDDSIENELSKHERSSWLECVDSIKEICANEYSQLGDCKVKAHTIRTVNEIPIYTPAYRKSEKEREELKIEVEKLLKAKIIRESKSPWSSPVILVPKKDGTKRMVVDYRKLNKITEVEHWPLPLISDIFDRLRGSEFYSALDLKHGYNQVRLSECSIPKSAFSTPDGHYEYLRLPFGLRNAPMEFCHIMHMILGHLPFVEIYLDDVVIHSASFKSHLKHIAEVCKILKNADLKLNGGKCTWLRKEVKILGHLIIKKDLKMDPLKISAVKERREPSTVKELQSFLGLCNYYRRFIKDFSTLAQPMFNLLKNDTKWCWSEDCQTSFENLKKALVS